MPEGPVLVFHPDPDIVRTIARELSSVGPLLRTLSDWVALPGELHRHAPAVVLLPFAPGDAAAEPLLRLVSEDTPASRIVLLVEPADLEAAARAEVFAAVAIAPALDGSLLRESVRRARAAPTPVATVLVVEDSIVNLEMIADLLHTKSYRVLRATAGEEGVEIAREALPDLILMDIYLPAMNGIEAVRCLAGHPRTASIPVIMLSASASDASVKEALAAGAAAFLLKPFSVRRLLETVACVLERAAATARV